jgi:hypothetical protein
MTRPLETQDHCALELFAPELIHESRDCSNVHSPPRILPEEKTLLMQRDVEPRTVNFQPTAVSWLIFGTRFAESLFGSKAG